MDQHPVSSVRIKNKDDGMLTPTFYLTSAYPRGSKFVLVGENPEDYHIDYASTIPRSYLNYMFTD